jgi:hypothetical protein
VRQGHDHAFGPYQVDANYLDRGYSTDLAPDAREQTSVLSQDAGSFGLARSPPHPTYLAIPCIERAAPPVSQPRS